MGFNYGYERKKFEAKWERLREEYAAAGMSEDAIDAMYRFDLDAFNGERAYCKHTQHMGGFVGTEVKAAAGEVVPPVQKQFLEKMSVEMPLTDPDRRYGWIDELDDEEMAKVIQSLPKRDVEFLSLHFEGYSQEEIALYFGVCRQVVTRRFIALRKKLKKI